MKQYVEREYGSSISIEFCGYFHFFYLLFSSFALYEASSATRFSCKQVADVSRMRPSCSPCPLWLIIRLLMQIVPILLFYSHFSPFRRPFSVCDHHSHPFLHQVTLSNLPFSTTIIAQPGISIRPSSLKRIEPSTPALTLSFQTHIRPSSLFPPQ